MNTFPPLQDGVLYLVGDGSEKPKPGTQNPVTQKGRKGTHKLWFWGICCVLLIGGWDVYRIPVAFRIILPNTHPDYRKEKQITPIFAD